MWLQSHFQAEGRLRIDRFMELALYDEEHGYYSRHLPTIGLAGDFSTSSSLSHALADRIAKWIGSASPRHVIECGAGTGRLSRGVLRELRLYNSERFGVIQARRRKPQHHIVERSPHLQRIQQKTLRRAATWHSSLPAALDRAKNHAFIFSNELVDAFPPRVFRKDENWHELFLTIQDRALSESWEPVSSLPDSTAFDHEWPAGQRIEVHESYHHWLASWIPQWQAGQLLTVDYGGGPGEIYHRRPSGSLRAYYRQRRSEGPEIYQMPGRQDLTADVNFDDLVRWGEQLGLETLSLTSQAEFLNLDPADLSPEDRFLCDPAGAGGAFKVLIQQKE